MYSPHGTRWILSYRPATAPSTPTKSAELYISARRPLGSSEVVPTITGARVVSARVRRAASRRASLSRKGAGDSGHRITSGVTGTTGQSGVTGYELSSGVPAR